jgi:hypothetical protein
VGVTRCTASVVSLNFSPLQGDAPVHSIGAALFAKKEELHFFDEIGY